MSAWRKGMLNGCAVLLAAMAMGCTSTHSASMSATTSAILPRGATSAEIRNAIENAEQFLWSQQKNGDWESSPEADRDHNRSGITALATYALLSAGAANTSDPRMQKAIDFLTKTKTIGSFSLAMRSLVWNSIWFEVRKQDKLRQVMINDAQALLQDKPDASKNSYTASFNALGLWAAEQTGFEVPLNYWKGMDVGWRGTLPPGDVPPGAQPSVSMTAAAVATLFIVDDRLYATAGLDCQGNVIDLQIEGGLKWLDDNFPAILKENPYFALCCISRVGRASGRQYFEGIDWYKFGTEYLVKDQAPDGSWGNQSVSSTALGLLFLAQNRAPVAMNKLQYTIKRVGGAQVSNWNERPRDAANFVEWMSRELERPPLNWQIVNLNSSLDDLHDAPVLYIAGNQWLDFTDQEIAKLREFVEEGGLIYANADCESHSFSNSFNKICRKLFPDYEFRELPADSPIYVNEQFARVKWKNPPRVEALSNGARELVILVSTSDPARFWQTRTYTGHKEGFQLCDDIWLYAIDRGEGGFWGNGENYIVRTDPMISAKKTIKVARLQFWGNWNPEPGSWRRLAAVVHNNDAVNLDIQSIQLGNAQLNNQFKIAHLTGTFKFTLSDAQRAEIRQFVDTGGTLIVDSCGGEAAFAHSAEKELEAIFPDDKLADAPLELTSPVYADGPKLTRVEYRPTARKILGTLRTPRIRAIEIKGRPAVFYSAEDLSCGMVGMPVDGIYGYTPDSATTLMEKLVLFAGK